MGELQDGTIKFHTENRAATHLGRKLYSTTPPALAELIANSYDAYASEVYVTINSSLDHIIVADNGIGMSLDALNEKYAPVGKEKAVEPVPPGFEKRAPMGQKGIGKLASFSLGDTFEIYTRMLNSDRWIHFVVEYDEFVNHEVEYSVPSEGVSLPDYLQQYGEFEHGFITVVKNLRRNVNQQTIDSLQTQLSRRFYIRASADKFQLYLNDDPVDLSRNAYYGDMDYATYIGFTEDEAAELFSKDGVLNIDLEQFNWDSKEDALKDKFGLLVSEKGLRGWIGTVDQPKHLKQHGNNANIVVYINNKIADEDVLKDRPNSMMANQYVVGEFFADYLSNDAEDPITSSRQGLDNADVEVQSLIDVIVSMRSTVLNTWDQRRETCAIKRLPAWVAESDAYQTWVNALPKPQKKLNDRLLKTITVQMDNQGQFDDDRTRALLNSFIDVVENNAIYQLADNLSVDDDYSQDEILVAIAELMARISASESIKQAGIVSERLKAIKVLEQLMEDESTLEKAFENHLAKNPWLINPYWNQTPKTRSEIQFVTQEFNRLYNAQNDDYRRTFIDICVYVAEEKFPIVVELKRNAVTSYSNATFTSIVEQIKRYRLAIIQKLGLSGGGVEEEEIGAYFIMSEDAGVVGSGNRIDFSKVELRMLQEANIKILTYRDLVNHAKESYREHIEVTEAGNEVPFFAIGTASSS